MITYSKFEKDFLISLPVELDRFTKILPFIHTLTLKYHLIIPRSIYPENPFQLPVDFDLLEWTACYV